MTCDLQRLGRRVRSAARWGESKCRLMVSRSLWRTAAGWHCGRGWAACLGRDTARRRIEFELHCRAFPQCVTAEQRIHERLRRSGRHLGFFQFAASLHAEVRHMVACTGRGKARLGRGVLRPRRFGLHCAVRDASGASLCDGPDVSLASGNVRQRWGLFGICGRVCSGRTQ